MCRKKYLYSLKMMILILMTAAILLNAADIAAKSKEPSFSVSGGVSAFSLGSVVPRIIVPGIGDRIRFTFDNPDYSEVTIRIFNIAGSLIRKNLPREEENIMYWDGTDDGNHAVRNGIYIYQIEVSGKIVNGTIVVAK